jgi:fatty-acid peroxygenase
MPHYLDSIAGDSMAQIPRDTNPDSTLALLSDGYQFISKRCHRYHSPVFQTRLLLQPFICMSGAEAAKFSTMPSALSGAGPLPRDYKKRCLAKEGAGDGWASPSVAEADVYGADDP